MASNNVRNPHCLVIAFPIQGHVNPILQFSKRLRSQGLSRITFVIPYSFLNSVVHGFSATSFPFPVEFITEGFDNGLPKDSVTTQEVLDRSWKIATESLGQLLEKLRSSGTGAADCLIYDAFSPWVLDVARKFGLTTAAFFTQSNAVNSIYFNAYKGDLKLPLSDPEIRITDGLPVFGHADMPSFIRDYESDRLLVEILMKQFMKVEMVDWIFVNTFYELEPEVCEWMAKIMPVRPIGPTIPSMYTDQRILDDKEYGLSAFTPVTDPCVEWLDKNDAGSVIYVSFGSLVRPGTEQIGELAAALKSSPFKFLWVVRASEESKLPQNYRQETSSKGLIVPWCNQLEVLAHAAVGCFVTHCGWNSTLEALNSGVPMVAVPQWSDQFMNAKFVKDVWKMGIRAKEDEKGIVRKEEFIECIKCVIEEDTIKTSAKKWKILARKAVDGGGTSDNNIKEFVSALKCGIDRCGTV